jgi:RNA polymerase sigma-32 factor
MDYINAQSHKSDLDFIRASMKMPLLEREEEYQLVYDWHNKKDEKALEKLISSYSRLVVSIALRYKHYHVSMSDLIQEGHIGLLEAAERFNPERDVRFASYARFWIRSYMQEFVLRNWSIVRTGSTTAQRALFFNLNRLRYQFMYLSDEFLTLENHEEISKILHVSIQDVAYMEGRLIHSDFSLNGSTHTESTEDRLQFIRDERPTPEEESASKDDAEMRHHWVHKAIQSLNPRERYIIIHRRLIEPIETLETVGKTLNITKERVRQLELRAMRKIKYFFRNSFKEAKEALDMID